MKNKALAIIKKLNENNFQAVFAGGCVRDMILGIESNDIDIATNATPDQVEKLFDKTIPVGKSFGVIIVVIDNTEFEVATFRNDGNYTDNRRPDSVSFSSMKEDSLRRDLSINGMFFDPIEDKIIDFVGGQYDLNNKIIRFIGDPEKRIQEDKLRILRAIRFAVKFDFEIETNTFYSIKNHAEEIVNISVERISEELLKMLRLHKPRKIFNLLYETNILKYILPEVHNLKNIQQPIQFHPEGDVFEHTIQALENLPINVSDELLMGTLLHDIGKPNTFYIDTRIRFNSHDEVGAKLANEMLKRMKFSNSFIERVVSLIENHMKFRFVQNMRMAKLKRFIRIPNFDEHLILHYCDCSASNKNLDNYNFIIKKMDEIPPEQIKPTRLITGFDLLSLGFIQGKIFKVIFSDIEDKQLEEIINSKEEAIKYIQENYSWLRYE